MLPDTRDAALRCDLTDLLVDGCAHCKGIPEIRPTADDDDQRPAGRGPWFTARYAGRCSHCATDFEPGDQIRADGEDGYLGECCGEDDE